MTQPSSGVRAFEEVVLQHSADAALLLHPTDGVVYASPAMAHVIGIPPADFQGMLAGEWVHPDDVQSAIDHRRLAASAGHSGPALIRGRHGDGTYHWFEAEWWHLATDHTVLHLRDAQRNQTAIETMSRELALTRAVLSHSEELVWVVHPDQRTVVHCSEASVAVLGRAPHDEVGTDWATFVHLDDHAALREALLGASATAAPARVQVQLLHVSGTWVPVRCTVRDLSSDPRVGGFTIHAIAA